MSLCPFLDQKIFMQACEQTVDKLNPPQTRLYFDLIYEEYDELFAAYRKYIIDSLTNERNAAKVVDGLIDLIYVCSGMLHSMGVDPNAAWNEVQRSNMSKVDAATGRVLKRDDGKVLKPDSYFPPDLVSVVKKSWGME